MNAERLRNYISLSDEIKEMEATVKDLKEQKDKAQEILLDEFGADGVQNLKIDGRTMYVNRSLKPSVSPGGQPALCAAFKSLGLGDMVKESVNFQTLGGWMRNDIERDVDDMPILPPEVQEIVSVFEDFSIRVRK